MSDRVDVRIRAGLADLPVTADPGFERVRARSRDGASGLGWGLALVAVLAAVLVLPRAADLRRAASPPASRAVDVADDFSGATVDPVRWRSTTSGIGASVAVTDGRVVIRIPAEAREDPAAPGLIAGSLGTRCLARGDYDVRVGFALAEWQTGLGVTLVLREAAPGSAAIMRAQVPGDVYATTIAPTPATPKTSDRSGALRLVRSGATASSFYFHEGAWVTFATGEASTADVAFEMTLWTDQATRASQRWRAAVPSAAAAVALDDFELAAAALVCP